MKKRFVAAVLLAVFVCLGFTACSFGGVENDRYLRIHIRANSNSDEDQAVKYKVKNAVVDFLTPLLAQAEDKAAAKNVVLDNKSGILRAADEVLRQNGFGYGCDAVVKDETFPTRTYEGLTLESGEYEALIVNLGNGEGDNWWCVVYPPLCFVGGEQTGGAIRYKSKLLEIINEFLKGK